MTEDSVKLQTCRLAVHETLTATGKPYKMTWSKIQSRGMHTTPTLLQTPPYTPYIPPTYPPTCTPLPLHVIIALRQSDSFVRVDNLPTKTHACNRSF